MAKCDECAAKAARTAAPPMAGEPPLSDGGGDIESRVATLEEQVATLMGQQMEATVASLDAMPVSIAQFS